TGFGAELSTKKLHLKLNSDGSALLMFSGSVATGKESHRAAGDALHTLSSLPFQHGLPSKKMSKGPGPY
uniref:Uncharacterized protein n=1 Tax=Falco tinnunculus TaxID=100819 RepID=A0A8C4TWI1_FALTI